VKSRRWCGKMNEKEMADVRAIALRVFADSFYWNYRNWKHAQGDKDANEKELEILRKFLEKYGDALSERQRKAIEHRIEYVKDKIREAEKAADDYHKALVESKEEIEGLLGESLCLE